MKKLLIFLSLMLSALLVQAAPVAGVDYKKLTPQATETGDKIEVLEFFWYGCPHCYTFEPYIKAWKKTKPANVVFKRVPAIFRPDWEIQARAYYALEIMGVIEEMHIKIFDAMHKDKKKKLRLNTKSSITNFVVKHGVDEKKFLAEYSSFAVDGMVRKAIKKQAAYEIQGVPSVIVNGKYLTSGSLSGSYENLINTLNVLIKQETK